MPLFTEGEPCSLTVLTRQTNGPVTLTLDPAKIEGPSLFVDWTPKPLRAGQPLRFTRSAQGLLRSGARRTWCRGW